MRFANPLRAGGAAFVAASLGGCASGYHDSELVGERYFLTPIDTWSVSILGVDGRDTVQRPARVDPGLRRVRVQGPTAPTSPQGETRSIELTVAACTRYYLVAVRPNALSADFRVKVDFEEPISGCTPPPAAR